MTALRERLTARERALLEVLKELWGEYRKQAVRSAKQRALLNQVLDDWRLALDGWAPHAKGPTQLAKLNRLAREEAHRRQDALRLDIEERWAAGKSLQQIADAKNLSKSVVHRALVRWGTTRNRPRHKAGTKG